MKWVLKTFEELTSIELYKILQLRNEIFIVEQESIYQDCDNKDISSYHLFAEMDNKMVAYLRIVKGNISYKEISIGRVVVDKAYRHKKIGRDIVKRAIDYIEETLKAYVIRISSQVYIKDFYADLGFKEVSEIYLEDNLPHIEMLYEK